MAGRMFNSELTAESYLTSHEVGHLLQVNPSSVNKWVMEGRIAAHRTPGGHRRISVHDLVSFLTAYDMPVPHVLKTAIALAATATVYKTPLLEPLEKKPAAKKTKKRKRSKHR